MTIGGEPWFVALDVCEALGLSDNTWKHTQKLDADERRKATRSSVGVEKAGTDMVFVAESDLYKLALRSDAATAKPFQAWVTRDVLPAIRKDGAYVLGEKVATGELHEDELILRAMEAMRRKVDRLTTERDGAVAQVARIASSFFRPSPPYRFRLAGRGPAGRRSRHTSAGALLRGHSGPARTEVGDTAA